MAARKKPTVDHELRAKGGSPLVLAVTLPAGEEVVYDPPLPPHPPLEVEHYIDGVLVATGVWPNMNEGDWPE